MAANTYKVIELVGSSESSVDEAIHGAIGRASETIKNLDWFEVREIRGNIQDGKVAYFQVKMGVGFRVLSKEDLHND